MRKNAKSLKNVWVESGVTGFSIMHVTLLEFGMFMFIKMKLNIWFDLGGLEVIKRSTVCSENTFLWNLSTSNILSLQSTFTWPPHQLFKACLFAFSNEKPVWSLRSWIKESKVLISLSSLQLFTVNLFSSIWSTISLHK